uniref:Transposable element P transposase n=1 Tax=Trichogramma kaykai TaxID=54128 RepID=A0ABD2WH30_9HYME
MVCDQSSSNRSAVKRLGITLENPSFTFKGNDISFGFNVPHMFKGIRNILLNNNFTVNGNIVSWLPIKQLYELEKGKSCKTARKLTERHIQPKAFEKMKVSLAVQVFSHSVGAALMTAALNKEIGLNTADLGIAAATSDFCTSLNRIFDCLNARSFSDPNPYRKGLSKSTRVEDELKKAMYWIKTIDRLKSKDIRYVLTSRLNQDKLENFFEFLRERCGYNNNPTLTQCIKNMQYAVLVTLLVPPVGTNCEADQARLLISNFNSYVKSKKIDAEEIDKKVEDWYIRNDIEFRSKISALHTTNTTKTLEKTENKKTEIDTLQTAKTETTQTTETETTQITELTQVTNITQTTFATQQEEQETVTLEIQTKKYIAGYLAFK